MKLEKKLNLMFSDIGRENALLTLHRANSLDINKKDAIKYAIKNNYLEAAKELALDKNYIQLASIIDQSQQEKLSQNNDFEKIEDYYDTSIQIKDFQEQMNCDPYYAFETLEQFCEFGKAATLAQHYGLNDLAKFYDVLDKKQSFDYLKKELTLGE